MRESLENFLSRTKLSSKEFTEMVTNGIINVEAISIDKEEIDTQQAFMHLRGLPVSHLDRKSFHEKTKKSGLVLLETAKASLPQSEDIQQYIKVLASGLVGIKKCYAELPLTEFELSIINRASIVLEGLLNVAADGDGIPWSRTENGIKNLGMSYEDLKRAHEEYNKETRRDK